MFLETGRSLMWWYGSPWTGMMGSWWGLHMLAGSLVWLGILALGVMAVRKFAPLRHVGRAAENTSSAIAILQERYARGEIGRDEYMEKQRDLRVWTAP
jgi:putative membrane protein